MAEPEFTDTARAGLLWVLWHHQGGSSKVGQAIRFALGKGAHEPLSDHEVERAKCWAVADFETFEAPGNAGASAVPSIEVWGVVHRETGAVDCVAEYEEGASYTLAEGYEKRKGIAYFPPPTRGVQVADEAQEREAFEAAMRPLHPEWAFTADPVFDYHNERTRCAWEGWKAALGVNAPANPPGVYQPIPRPGPVAPPPRDPNGVPGTHDQTFPRQPPMGDDQA